MMKYGIEEEDAQDEKMEEDGPGRRIRWPNRRNDIIFRYSVL